MVKRKFQLEDEKSSKFWQIEQKGKQQTVWYGRIGTNGQTKTRSFQTPALAKAATEKLVAQKLGKGYVELGRSKKTTSQIRKNAGVKKKPKASQKTSAKKFSTARFKEFFKPLSKRELKGHPRLTTTLLKRVEKQRGVKFPAAMVKLLKIQNGRYLTNQNFRFGRRDYLIDEVWPIHDNGIEALVPEFSDHLEMAERGRLSKPELLFPFTGDGHCFFALDYRKTGTAKEPQIVYLDIEGKISCKKIADTFEDFLAGWEEPTDNPKSSRKHPIDFDLIEKDTIIGTEHSKKAFDHDPRHRRLRWSWLCVEGQCLVHYERRAWQKKRRNGEWKEEFESDWWLKHSVKLSDIFSVEKSLGEITINHPVMRATKGKKPVKPASQKKCVTSVEMTREGAKPWKIGRAKRETSIFGIPIGRSQIDKCLRKIRSIVKK